jgi:hypothetical protein
MLVSVALVLAEPVAVTAMAAAGVSPGDALEAIGVDRGLDEAVPSPGPEPAPPASSRDDGATAPGELIPSGRRPSAPEPGVPAEPLPEPTATTPASPGPAAEPEEPAEPGPETPSGHLGGVDDVLDDPVGPAEDLLDEGLNGLSL